jgi:hypothetical protein
MKLDTVVPLYSNRAKFPLFSPVFWIRIRKDLKLVRRSGSVVTLWIRSQLQVKDGYAAKNGFVIVIICQTMNKNQSLKIGTFEKLYSKSLQSEIYVC